MRMIQLVFTEVLTQWRNFLTNLMFGGNFQTNCFEIKLAKESAVEIALESAIILLI